MFLSNIGILTTDHPVYGQIFDLAVPLAIPLLFSLDLKEWGKLAKSAILSFLIAVVGVSLIVLITGLTMDVGPEGWKVGGMFIKAQGISSEVPDKAIGILLGNMPPILTALGLTAIIAATMSTAQIGIIAGSSILIRDVIFRILNKEPSKVKDLVNTSRWVTLIYALASIIGAILFNMFVPILGSAFALAVLSGFIASLVPPLFGTMFWKKSKKEGVFLGFYLVQFGRFIRYSFQIFGNSITLYLLD